jgi:hypothetical protein
MTNAEQNVLDAIDQLEVDEIDDLVDWQLGNYANRSGYDYDVNQVACDLCGDDWHGLPEYGCPGAAASDEQRQEYLGRPGRHHGVFVDQVESVRISDGYNLADIERMRGGFSRSRTRPTVRFWTTGPDSGLQMVQGTLDLSSVERNGDSMTVIGHLLPDTEGITMRAYSWLPGDDPDPQPVNGVSQDSVTAEVAVGIGDGFEPIGFCSPDDIQIDTDTEIVRSWGGQTVRARHETTLEFSLWETGPAFDRLFRP